MSSQYRTAEKLLYAYPVNTMRYREAVIEYMRLRGETDCHGQSYGMMSGHSEPSDPPNEYVNRLQAGEQQIKKYSELVRSVREVRIDLKCSEEIRDRVLLQIMELVYFENMSMRELALHLGMNERTLYRRREELVRKVIARRKENAVKVSQK